MPEEARNLDVLSEKDDVFHVLYEGRSRHALLQHADYKTKTFTFRIEGNVYTVKVEDAFDRLVQHLGLSKGSTKQMNQLKAPMPGLVVQVLAQPGMSVQKGDPLIILEAMKMENVIKAAGEGKVKAVNVAKGAAVEKGYLLIEFE